MRRVEKRKFLRPDTVRDGAGATQTVRDNPRIADEHYPPRPEGALARSPRPQSGAEAAFLAIGPGAEGWLIRAAATGTSRIRAKMAEAVALGALLGAERVEAALVRAAEAERAQRATCARSLTTRPTRWT